MSEQQQNQPLGEEERRNVVVDAGTGKGVGTGSRDLPRPIIASKVTGTVKWFNVKAGYGFITR